MTHLILETRAFFPPAGKQRLQGEDPEAVPISETGSMSMPNVGLLLEFLLERQLQVLTSGVKRKCQNEFLLGSLKFLSR